MSAGPPTHGARDRRHRVRACGPHPGRHAHPPPHPASVTGLPGQRRRPNAGHDARWRTAYPVSAAAGEIPDAVSAALNRCSPGAGRHPTRTRAPDGPAGAAPGRWHAAQAHPPWADHRSATPVAAAAAARDRTAVPAGARGARASGAAAVRVRPSTRPRPPVAPCSSNDGHRDIRHPEAAPTERRPNPHRAHRRPVRY